MTTEMVILIKLNHEKSFQKVAPGRPTKFHFVISNVATFGDHFRFQMRKNLRVACKLGLDLFIEMKFRMQFCKHFLNRLYFMFQLDKCNHLAVFGKF